MIILCIILGLLGCIALWAMVRYEPAITAAMVAALPKPATPNPAFDWLMLALVVPISVAVALFWYAVSRARGRQ